MTNGWTPLGLSQLLRKGGVFRTWIGDKELAVWRSAAGQVHAWDNRCPHRGMRLHHGFVRGEQLACLYHGWHYGEDGACAKIPAHPDLEPPSSICVPTTPCVEADGVVWAGGEDGNPPKMPTGYTRALRSIHVACSADKVVASIGGWVAVVDAATGQLAIAVQAFNQVCVLHALAAEDTSADDMVAQSVWLAALRDKLETGEATP